MSTAIFLEDNISTYEVIFNQIGEHQIRLIFKDKKPEDKILLSGFNLVNEHNGYIQTVREDYKYIYRTYDDDRIVELCDDESQYIEPEPIPNPGAHEPTLEELETLFQYNKKEKIELSKMMLANYLENHPMHSTAHNGVDGIYSVTSDKQALMTSQYMTYQIEKSINPSAKLTWNETGKSCEDWLEEEFLQLVLDVKSYVSPLVSHQQHIEEAIYSCSNQEELDQILIDYNKIS